jgi:hypothetical protein
MDVSAPARVRLQSGKHGQTGSDNRPSELLSVWRARNRVGMGDIGQTSHGPSRPSDLCWNDGQRVRTRSTTLRDLRDVYRFRRGPLTKLIGILGNPVVIRSRRTFTICLRALNWIFF